MMNKILFGLATPKKILLESRHCGSQVFTYFVKINMMGAMEANEISALERKAREIRGLTIEEIGYLGTGHIGGALSVVDILVLLYERVMSY